MLSVFIQCNLPYFLVESDQQHKAHGPTSTLRTQFLLYVLTPAPCPVLQARLVSHLQSTLLQHRIAVLCLIDEDLSLLCDKSCSSTACLCAGASTSPLNHSMHFIWLSAKHLRTTRDATRVVVGKLCDHHNLDLVVCAPSAASKPSVNKCQTR